MCQMQAPELITLRDDDGHAEAVDRDLEAGELEAAGAAVQACPEQAISLG
jgi:ferredoxin